MVEELAREALAGLAGAGAERWDGQQDLSASRAAALDISRVDFAAQLLRRMKRVAQTRGIDLARPEVMYHWTPAQNFDGIARDNFRVPKEQDRHATRHLYGSGVYACVRWKCTGNCEGVYGKQTADRCVLALGVVGKPYEASAGVDGGKPLVRGCDSHVFCPAEADGADENIYVFFSSDQLLPCFIVGKEGVEAAERAATALADRLFHALTSVPLQEQAPVVEALGLPAQAGPIRKGARVVVENSRLFKEWIGHHGKVHSVYLSCASELWASVWIDPGRPHREHPARFRVSELSVEPGSEEAPPLRQWEFSKSLVHDVFPVPPSCGVSEVPYGIMAPEGVLSRGHDQPPVPVVIGMPGGYMDHVSEFYRAWCVENRGWVAVVPYAPPGQSSSFFMSVGPEFVDSLIEHLASRIPIEGAPHWVGRCNGTVSMLRLCAQRPACASSLSVLTGGFTEGTHVWAIPALSGIPIAFHEPGYNENQGSSDHDTKRLFDEAGHQPPAELTVYEDATARDIDRAIDMDQFWGWLESHRKPSAHAAA